jgi:hypothetical protein
MKTIIVLCDPRRVDPNLISSLQQLFPECEIKIVFTGKEDPGRISGKEVQPRSNVLCQP